MKFVEERSNGGTRLGFGFQRRKLRIGEVIAFGVGEEPIDAASDVTDMEGEGRQTVRLGVEVFLGESEAPVVDALGGEFESVEDGEVNGGQVFFATAEPGFGLFGRRHGYGLA